MVEVSAGQDFENGIFGSISCSKAKGSPPKYMSYVRAKVGTMWLPLPTFFNINYKTYIIKFYYFGQLKS